MTPEQQREVKQLVCSCGGTMFRRFRPARGTWEELLESKEDGRIEMVESFTDGVQLGRHPKTIFCADCRKRHPNPDWTP